MHNVNTHQFTQHGAYPVAYAIKTSVDSFIRFYVLCFFVSRFFHIHILQDDADTVSLNSVFLNAPQNKQLLSMLLFALPREQVLVLQLKSMQGRRGYQWGLQLLRIGTSTKIMMILIVIKIFIIMML